MWELELDRVCDTPLQLQIFQYYYQAITRGNYVCGDMLPSIRKLASKLQVARITVVLAYEKLVIGGYIKSRPGIGYQVVFDRQVKPVRHTPSYFKGPAPTRLLTAEVPGDLYSQPTSELYCRMSIPDPNAFPWASWRKWNNSPSCLKEQLVTRYHSPHGLLPLRQEIARYLRLSRSIETRPENIIITNGVQEGLSLLSQLFVLKRTTSSHIPCHIVTESPCYSGAWHLFNYYGAQVTTLDVDKQGMCVSHLPERSTQLCYVTPSHQYPLGSQLSLSRRKTLLLWAQRVGAYVIEDDYDAVFSWGQKPLPPLKAMDSQDRVIYAGTFSKTLGPGIRLGYLVCPDAILPSVQNMKALSNSGSNWLLQQFLAEFMHSQVFYTHLSKLTCEYEMRQNLLRKGLKRLFPEGQLWGHAAGLHLTLITSMTDDVIQRLRQRCLQAGVRFDTLRELENGSETTWRAGGHSSPIFFGFGNLNSQQLKKVLLVIEQQLLYLDQEHGSLY
ncbi:HTH-type transcriptional regulatory protein gabR [Serratia quinivorans]|uniref:MocR-like pyridoxine biosynthesis transcription factor PdxR n=1 Tax=Serratia quinivorans TaxID=137545 RepID=UPI0021774C39|nr:PLP-dependent aminotransferase family protein [Serratia quinivorans]CAI1884921.1 HTH-type transcriptional regulatory protein gabR [Serratia quinivorans]CAI1889817.1 HTH-type transcriptional regulatory protein gabR [Serratia quinivorans]